MEQHVHRRSVFSLDRLHGRFAGQMKEFDDAIFKMFDRERRRERQRRQRQKIVGCCKQMVAFLFSHVGLAGMVVAYSIMGGFLFRALEAPAEHRVKVRIVAMRDEKVEDIWRLVVAGAAAGGRRGGAAGAAGSTRLALDHGNFTRSVTDIFRTFQREVRDAVKEQGWDGKDDMNESTLQWSFAGALLYAVTVITTIGYGHVAPKTNWGRLLTIVYALIGIPLTFLYLSNIGNFLADAFRLFYKRVCCDVLCCEKCARKRKRQRLKLRRRRELMAAAADQHSTKLVDWSPGDVNYDEDEDVEMYRERGSNATAGGGENLAYDGDGILLPVPVSGYRRQQTQLSNASSSSWSTISSTAVDEDRLPQLSGVDTRETAILDDYEDDDDEEQQIRQQPQQPIRLAVHAPVHRPIYDDDVCMIRETDIVDDDHVVSSTRSPFSRPPRIDVIPPRVEFHRSTETSARPAARSGATPATAGAHEPPSTSKASSDCASATATDPASDLTRPRGRHRLPRSQSDPKLSRLGVVFAPELPTDSRRTREASGGAAAFDPRPGLIRRAASVKTRGKVDRTGRGAAAAASSSPHRLRPLPPIAFPSQRRSGIDWAMAGLRPDAVAADSSPETKWMLLKELLLSRQRESPATSKRPSSTSDSAPLMKNATGRGIVSRKLPNGNVPAAAAAVDDSDATTTKSGGTDQSALSRFRLVVSKLSRSRTPAVSDDTSGKQAMTTKKQTSVESFVTAPSDDDAAADEDDSSPLSSARQTTAAADDNSQDGQSATTPTKNNNNRNFGDIDGNFSTIIDVGAPTVSMYPDPLQLMAAGYDIDPFEYELDGDESSDDIDGQKVTVPVSICLVLIAGYIFAGAVLFTLWEDWDYLTGSYFCFITLSTIGFGDIVPGTDMDKWASHEKLVLCALWLAFGLSLLAMCFNLMQEEVKEKCKWLGQKLGLLKDDGDAR